ncbi:MAG: protein kinase, partial [Gammaproteobacteria bacterium]|nr:protein kinase [Gammaproteobacteria bacterium]
MAQSRNKIDSFNLVPGRILARKYEVEALLGSGWEGEVYLIRELATGIERTAKIFFPERNIRDKNVKFYAKKLHKLRHCPIVIQYSAQDHMIFKGSQVTLLISEYVEGELLSQFIKNQPGKRLGPFQALHLLYALTSGMECVHRIGEYHGDLHTDNVIVQRFGLGFELKLVDLFQGGPSKRANIQADTVDMIHIFYEALGGQKHYSKQPQAVKDICCGLKSSLILKKFKSA